MSVSRCGFGEVVFFAFRLLSAGRFRVERVLPVDCAVAMVILSYRVVVVRRRSVLQHRLAPLSRRFKSSSSVPRISDAGMPAACSNERAANMPRKVE